MEFGENLKNVPLQVLVSSMLHVSLKMGSRFPYVYSFFTSAWRCLNELGLAFIVKCPGSAFATVARRS